MMRANQAPTLDYFATVGKGGATIGDVARQFDIRISSARSRVLRCASHGWLDETADQGPTGPRRRFHITPAGKAVVSGKNVHSINGGSKMATKKNSTMAPKKRASAAPKSRTAKATTRTTATKGAAKKRAARRA